jgi:hypothetical protein
MCPRIYVCTHCPLLVLDLDPGLTERPTNERQLTARLLRDYMVRDPKVYLSPTASLSPFPSSLIHQYIPGHNTLSTPDAKTIKAHHGEA